MSDEIDRITAYLAWGRLFIPERAKHYTVRDLLIDCRAALAAAPAQERIDALELEVRQLTERTAALRKVLELAIKQNSHDMLMTGEELRQCEAALAAQQPAPSAATAEQQMVAYLDIGAGGYIDLGSELPDETLLRLPKGRHALVIAGTFGIDGYVAAKPAPTPQAAQPVEDGLWLAVDAFWSAYHNKFARVRGDIRADAPLLEEVKAMRAAMDALQPYPTPQADSQPAPLREGEWINDAGRIKWLLWRVQDLEAKLAARAPADSVLEDAYMLLQDVAACFTRDDDLPDNLLPRIDAALKARKQGANHD